MLILRMRHQANIPPAMSIQAVGLLIEAERLERSGEVEDLSRAMTLALRAAELVIAAQEQYQQRLTLEVQARRQQILVQAALVVDMWVEEELEEEGEAFLEEWEEEGMEGMEEGVTRGLQCLLTTRALPVHVT